jgi:hypothetical protein
MADRPEESIAPPRTLSGATQSDHTQRSAVILPPPPPEKPKSKPRGSRKGPGTPSEAAPTRRSRANAPNQTRKATLRLVQIEPWSVMKAAFLLSVALGIVMIVAVTIVWGVLGAAGLWDSVNSIIRDSIGDNTGTPFEIQKYLGTSRVVGFTMIVAVFDIILLTAIATLGAFLYNLAATLLGGVEVTFAEDR